MEKWIMEKLEKLKENWKLSIEMRRVEGATVQKIFFWVWIIQNVWRFIFLGSKTPYTSFKLDPAMVQTIPSLPSWNIQLAMK